MTGLTRQMYDEAMDGIKKHLIGRTRKSNLMFTQELHPAKHPESGEQYVCTPLGLHHREPRHEQP